MRMGIMILGFDNAELELSLLLSIFVTKTIFW